MFPCMPYDWACHGFKEIPEVFTIYVNKLFSNGSHYPNSFVDLFRYHEWFSAAR